MALVKTEQFSQSFNGMSRLPAVRQLGLLIGLAASIAIGVGIVLWSQTPSYSLLYGNLGDHDAADVADALQRANIPFKLDDRTGGILVPTGKLYDARLKLAGQGLPKGSGMGYEILQQEQGLGTSRFIEVARYHHALEVELERTVSSLANVRAARVHLAIPKPSVFVRANDKPRASVLITLEPGRSLDKGQVQAIVHLVASSVPNLAADDVQVIDQQGHLLTMPMADRAMALSSSHFEYTRQLEQNYAQRIENILSPVVGADGVRAEVAADLDFSSTERTRESYNPDLPAVRSEQTVEETTKGASSAGGVPGALSNEPPAAGSAPQVANGTAANSAASTVTPLSSTKRVTRNYELDRTISHTRLGTGEIKRLSVAVLVDDAHTVDANGNVSHKPRSAQEMARLTDLVKDAVGFDARRGDTVNVINVSFESPPQATPLPQTPLWQRPWVWDAAKEVGGVLLILLLAFGVLRPVMRSLADKGRAAPAGQALVPLPAGQVPAAAAYATGQEGAAGQPPQLTGPTPDDYAQKMTSAQTLAKEDPKRVAQVVKTWVASDG